MKSASFILAGAMLAGCADLELAGPITPEQAAMLSRMQPIRPYQMTFTPIGATPQPYTLSQPIVALPQHSVNAMWTGAQEPVTTVTGLSAWRCQYSANGQSIWRIFQTSCPSSISVQ